MIRVALAVAALLVPAAASAQAYRCAIPGALPQPRADGPDQRDPRRVMPIGGYTLALTWAAQYCRTNSGDDSAKFQCNSGNRFGFTLHGLWPDGIGKQWPQYCAPTPLLSEDVLRRNLCATPSVQLLQHEYAKHGTCMGISPTQYFARSTALYGRLRYPDMNALSRRPGLTAGQFATAFARANRGISANMLKITANRGGWLDEVWICLDKSFAYTACKPKSGGLRASVRLKIWRGA
jgi:ribonuclease T2